jgi:glycosyltransferase involved in cell wall biosynthesis
MNISYYCNWYVNRQRPHHIAKLFLEKKCCLTIYTTKGLRKWKDPISLPVKINQTRRIPSVLGKGAILYNRWKYIEIATKSLLNQDALHIYGGEPIENRYEYNGYLIYDCMDDWSAFPNADPKVNEYEKVLCEKADEIWVVSKKLLEKIQNYKNKGKVKLLPNGVDCDHFHKALEIRQTIKQNKRRPVLGYVGLVSSWFNTKLVRDLADLLDKWDIHIIGPRHDLTKQQRQEMQHERIKILGYVHYDDLPKYLASFDVAMIPFHVNDLIKATNPIKLYEYLAAGVPTVSTEMPEILSIVTPGVLDCKETAEDFAESVEAMYREKNVEKCLKIAESYSWENIFKEELKNMIATKKQR